MERRKHTPPDLLALSNMYFDRRQRMMAPSPKPSLQQHPQPAVSPAVRQVSESYTCWILHYKMW